YRITHPTTAAATISQAEFTRNRSSAIKLTPNTTSVVRSTIDAFPNCHVTTAINARDPATTPSSAAAAAADLRSCGISGPLTVTSTNPGTKIPIVATAAPIQPATMYPINVAVVNSGPGVNWPTETASINCLQALHKLGLQKRQQDISTAEHHRPNFQKRQKQPTQPNRKRRACSRHRHRPGDNLRKPHCVRKPNYAPTHQPVLHRQSRRRYQSGKHQHQHRTDSQETQPRRQHGNHRQQ